MEQFRICDFSISINNRVMKVKFKIDNPLFSCFKMEFVEFKSDPSEELFYMRIHQEYWFLYEMVLDNGSNCVSLKHFDFGDQLSEFLDFIKESRLYESYIGGYPTEIRA